MIANLEASLMALLYAMADINQMTGNNLVSDGMDWI